MGKMKFCLSLSLLLSSAAAYQTPMEMTFSLGKFGKKPAKKAAPKATSPSSVTSVSGPSPSAQAWAAGGPSTALPFATAPVGPWFLGNEGRQGRISDLNWYREAELIHGRIAQLAVLGFLVPGLLGTFPGNEWTGVDAYSYTDPLEAFNKCPKLALLQILLFMTFLEVRRINIIKEEGASYQPGDLRIGQGEGRWNPFGLTYTVEQYEEKRLQELKHCRLAMVGIFGLWAQALASHESVADQLGNALVVPEYYAKAGYFLPEGI